MLRYLVPAVLALVLLVSSGCNSGLDYGPLFDAQNRYFVDAENGSDDNTGQRDAPLATIQAGIDMVAETGGEVIVAGGAYRETVQLVSAFDLRGSFDPADWTYDPENHRSVIRSPEGSPLHCVLGIGVATVLVEGFAITNEVEEREFSQFFSIAVRFHDAMDVTFIDNVIFADQGLDRGEPGAFHPQTSGGDDGDEGQDAPVCTGFASRQSGGTGGQGGLGGDGGRGGSGAGFTSGNSTPTAGANGDGGVGARGGRAASDGFFADAGQRGANGNRGVDGAGGTGFGALNGAEIFGPYSRASGSDGTWGTPGRGGGGGGGGQNAFGFCGGSGGGGGEGGSAGIGGQHGVGGEPSFGIMLTACEDVLISGNSITTLRGGRGGDGIPGGLGGNGGRGGAGGNAPFGVNSTGRGGDGGDGGDGGTGGHGGGGAGGPSIGIVEDAASVGIQLRDNIFDIGPGGNPGTSGSDSTPAEAGLQAEHLKLEQ